MSDYVQNVMPQALRAYRRGESMDRIAERYGISKFAIRDNAKRRGLPMRSKGRNWKEAESNG